MSDQILEDARELLQKEILALQETTDALDESFVQAVRLIQNAKGKVVVSGVGKSGLIGQKIAATMSSMGTVAVFLHPTDALHGDLGMVNEGDVIIAISHSGTSDEILAIIAPLRRIGAKIIAMVGNVNSELALAADGILRLVVHEEADHLNLAPTASALATLALGDAVAGCLSKLRNFKHEDFAKYHPAGAIGRRLLLTVRDLMHGGDELPIVLPDATVDEVLTVLTDKRLGGVNVVTNRETMQLAGVITDGDLKRALKQREKFFSLCAADMMTKNPTVVCEEDMASHALELMENRPFQILVLPVLSKPGAVVGLLRLHDLLKMT
ncbi:TPA: KpsF/GutQ family sugar-phosphate isomerase [Candidatus Sumerlaeota bacterium]|nr:KpsF/GutQ family sugar-phosphate isomerase [Candidatus Sumerlaeota bacterium]